MCGDRTFDISTTTLRNSDCTTKNGTSVVIYCYRSFSFSQCYLKGLFYCGSVWRRPVAIADIMMSLSLRCFRGQCDFASGSLTIVI